MRKKFFDLKLSHFSKYLNEIGILIGSDIEQFKKQFYEISSDIYNSNDISCNDNKVNFIYFKETISNALVSFIKSISEEKKKLIALNLFMKSTIKEDIIREKLLNVIKIYSKKILKLYFSKWKSNDIVMTNELKRTISSHILSNISNYRSQIEPKNNFSINDKENNLTNDNTIDTNNNYRNNLKVNNSMANLTSQMLNISTTPDIYNYNFNNYSCYENSFAENMINNYIYDRKYKPINLGELNNTYSTNYYRPNGLNNSNSYNYIQNYMNRTNYNKKYKYPGKYTINNNSNISNNYNLSTSKSKDLSISKIKHKVNIDYLNNLSKSKTEHNLIPEKTTQYRKEQEELNNFCTFKPKINKSSSFSRYNVSNKKSIDRLYLDSKNRMARKELQYMKKTNLESKQNTFQPKFISSSVKKVKPDFEQRLKDFENTKKNNIKKISADLEKEQKLQYTFSPKINEPQSNKKNDNPISNSSKATSVNQSTISKRKKIPVYKRLYNDNIGKKLLQEERVKEQIEKIRKNSIKNTEGGNFDTKKIEELYNDYKSKKSRLQKKQEQIRKEQGITFKPELISEKKYYDKINPDFYEREKQFLEKQQQNIESYKLFIENEENKKKKKYSDEEKKEIYSNIVSRLYKDGVIKYIQKRNNNIDNINYNNENLIIKNKSYKNNSEISNRNDNGNELEFENEPQEEIFKSNFGNIEINNDYMNLSSEDKN